MVQPHDRLSRALLFAPLVFVAHFLEESPGFVPWFNAHVTRGITTDLFLTNAVFHVAGAIVDRGYMPGLATAILLYLPYCGWVGGSSCATAASPPGLLVAAAVLGAIPMAVHGYLILFLGARLF